jgi:hypothetical protein
VTVLVFESPGSGRKVALINYACHPVIVQAQDRVSADYVGVMTSALERRIPGPWSKVGPESYGITLEALKKLISLLRA